MIIIKFVTAWTLVWLAGLVRDSQGLLQPRQQATSCSLAYFSTIVPAGLAVERVEHVTTGYFVESGNLGYPSFASGLPPLCAVIIQNTTADYRFGMFLPDTWNAKLLVVGNYAFLGGINWLDMGPGPKYAGPGGGGGGGGGMASLSTDTGHNSGAGDQTWADTDRKQRNWAYEALDGSIRSGKRLIRAYYAGDRPIAYTYFSGCSTGGRQGLKQMQRDPDAFDGALIGAPAWDTRHLMPWVSKLAVWNLPEAAPHALGDPTLLARLQAEVLAQCDRLDGVSDGIVSAPDLCRLAFDITKIRCGGGGAATDGCWTQSQIETAKKMYGDYTSSKGTLIYSGLTHSSEAEWTAYLFPIAPEAYNVRRNFDAQFERYFLQYGPDWPITSYNDSVVDDPMDSGSSPRGDDDLEPPAVAATAEQYDLGGEFRDRGHKIIMYGGLADGTVPVRHTTLYYERTKAAMAMAGDLDIDAFFRYFQIPGMGHCWGTAANVQAPWMLGGAGQAAQRPPYNSGWSVPLGFNDSRHDALLALMGWVEGGRAPDEIVASEFNFTDATAQAIVLYRQRPICVYPRVAVWDRKGVQDEAESWRCE